MPVIFIYAINTMGGRDNKLYESPIYRKPARKEVGVWNNDMTSLICPPR